MQVYMVSAEREVEGVDCTITYVCQKTAMWSWVFSSTFMWVPEIKFGLPGLCSKCLYPLHHLIAPQNNS